MRKLAAVLAALTLAACGGGSSHVAVPKGVTFRVEQARQDLQNRNFEMQVVNHSSKAITVSRVEFTSKRLKRPSIYHGPATIAPGATTGLGFAMSMASCGTGIQATATLRYRVGNGKTVTSVVHPQDHDASVALFMKRDCAQSSLARTVIDPTLTRNGSGSDSTLRVGITFTPRATGGPVEIGPIDGTTLLKAAPGSNLDTRVSAGGTPQRAYFELIPNRCDIHVVAEDRTGATLPLHITSKVSGTAFFFLKFDEAQKSQIYDFIADHCEFGKKQDPLNAP